MKKSDTRVVIPYETFVNVISLYIRHSEEMIGRYERAKSDDRWDPASIDDFIEALGEEADDMRGLIDRAKDMRGGCVFYWEAGTVGMTVTPEEAEFVLEEARTRQKALDKIYRNFIV